MINKNKITEIFCIADDFRNIFDTIMEKYTIITNSKSKYHCKFTMSKAEI